MGKYNYRINIFAFIEGENVTKNFLTLIAFKHWLHSKEFSQYTQKNMYTFTFTTYITKPETNVFQIKFWDSKYLKKFAMSKELCKVDETDMWWVMEYGV